MKLISLALVASVAVAGFAYAQTATPAPAAAPAASSGSKISHDCKKEYEKLCGRHAGSQKQDCIKSNLDLGKFSDKCKAEFSHAAAKPKS